MFVIPCKYVDQCLIEESVKYVRLYHPTSKILIVDSDSDDKSYFKKLEPYNVIIADVANQHYEIGALWYAVKNYVEDSYVLMQDSIIFNKSINNKIDDTKLFACFSHFFEPLLGNFSHVPTEEWLSRINQMMGEFGSISGNQQIVGAFGTNFIINRRLIDLMLAKNLHKTFLPTAKQDSWMSERICGIIPQRCGVDVTTSIAGEYHELKAVAYNSNTQRLHTEYFDKIFFGRQ